MLRDAKLFVLSAEDDDQLNVMGGLTVGSTVLLFMRFIELRLSLAFALRKSGFIQVLL